MWSSALSVNELISCPKSKWLRKTLKSECHATIIFDIATVYSRTFYAVADNWQYFDFVNFAKTTSLIQMIGVYQEKIQLYTSEWLLYRYMILWNIQHV